MISKFENIKIFQCILLIILVNSNLNSPLGTSKQSLASIITNNPKLISVNTDSPKIFKKMAFVTFYRKLLVFFIIGFLDY